MQELSQERILRALAEIRTPDGSAHLGSLVGGLQIKDGTVRIALEVPSHQAEAMSALRVAAESALRALAGVTKAQVILTSAEQPPAHTQPRTSSHGGSSVSPQDSRDTSAPKRQRHYNPRPIPGVSHVVAVASGKGGVGKSTLAVHLACALHALGMRVGILDADVYGPSVPRMLGNADKPGTGKKGIVPIKAHGLTCMSIGFLIPPDAPLIWRGPMIQKALRQMLHQVEWGELDCMIVDLPPGTGDAQLSLVQQVVVDGVVLISTPQEVALQAARKGLQMFQKLRIPIVGLVENMSFFICPHCAERSEIFHHAGARQTARAAGITFLGEIPLDLCIRRGGDIGKPVVCARIQSPAAQIFMELGRKVGLFLERSGKSRP